jgi:hypothetical protein
VLLFLMTTGSFPWHVAERGDEGFDAIMARKFVVVEPWCLLDTHFQQVTPSVKNHILLWISDSPLQALGEIFIKLEGSIGQAGSDSLEPLFFLLTHIEEWLFVLRDDYFYYEDDDEELRNSNHSLRSRPDGSSTTIPSRASSLLAHPGNSSNLSAALDKTPRDSSGRISSGHRTKTKLSSTSDGKLTLPGASKLKDPSSNPRAVLAETTSEEMHPSSPTKSSPPDQTLIHTPRVAVSKVMSFDLLDRMALEGVSDLEVKDEELTPTGQKRGSGGLRIADV